MEKTMNGSGAEPGAPVKMELVRNVVNTPTGRKLIYNLRNGQYVGTLTMEAMSPEVLKAMAQDFPNYIAEATGGLQVAQAMPGLAS